MYLNLFGPKLYKLNYNIGALQTLPEDTIEKSSI